MKNKITVVGARVHNLKNITVEIPKHQLVVVTGVSGSGKSSLTFETVFAEGQRRYIESLSAYARQFLQVLEKPDVDSIEGLSPTISVDQKSVSHNPRSTVGTVTEVHDYLRLLFARIGKPHCPKHGIKLEAQSTTTIVQFLLDKLDGRRINILSPLVIGRRGEYVELFQTLAKKGFSRVRVDGEIYDVDSPPELAKTVKHTIEIVVDRLVVKKDARQRIVEAVEIACQQANGRLHVLEMDNNTIHPFSTQYACEHCGYAPPELEPKLFSFNNPNSACKNCDGLGRENHFSEHLIIENQELSLAGGAIRGWDKRNPYYFTLLQTMAKHFKIDLEKPFRTLSKKQQHIVLYGHKDILHFKYTLQSGQQQGQVYQRRAPFEGVINNIARRWRETDSPQVRETLGRYITDRDCEQCYGARLGEDALAVKINGLNIDDMTKLSIDKLFDFFQKIKLDKTDSKIADKVIKEITNRINFLLSIGLNYLSLNRPANTLSGGEGQRIRLASQIGSGLTGVTYVLDEPSIGLHQHDNKRLIETLKYLRDLDNSVLVIEHDEEAILSADYVIDVGPGAGVHGGKIVAAGTPKQIKKAKTLTGQYLRGEKQITIPRKRRTSKDLLTVKGATGNNLKGDDFSFPIGVISCVTGVSGSGKSSLVHDTITRSVMRHLYNSHADPLPHHSLEGLEHFDKIVVVDQSPIGRTPRSNPATYTGMFTGIRDFYTKLPLARERGYNSGRFSFNVAGGRCETCEGDGVMRIAMHFLPDVFVQCETCSGKRYNKETLEILYKGKSISDILDMTVEEGLDFFKNIPLIHRKLDTLQRVGLGYITIGQKATTLSGGEAQRVKLSLELSKKQTGKTLYILDEPTTGLHFHDVNMLTTILHELADKGNTVIIIEHNLDIIKIADWIVDLGPSGGVAGGKLIASGTPEKVSKNKKSLTGKFLAPMLKK